MKKLLAAFVPLLLTGVLVSAALAGGHSGIKLKPTAGRGNPPSYKTIGNGTAAQAQWTNKAAHSGRFSVLLDKSVPTTDYAFAAAVVDGVEGDTVADLGNIGFWAKGQCGGGAPRFNLYYDTNSDGEADGVAFYGCGNHVVGTDGAWTHMEADASAPESCYTFNPTIGPCTLTDASTVTSLSVLVDEQGTYYVDDVTAAGDTTGEPGGR